MNPTLYPGESKSLLDMYENRVATGGKRHPNAWYHFVRLGRLESRPSHIIDSTQPDRASATLSKGLRCYKTKRTA